jgi:hypothetical protein
VSGQDRGKSADDDCRGKLDPAAELIDCLLVLRLLCGQAKIQESLPVFHCRHVYPDILIKTTSTGIGSFTTSKHRRTPTVDCGTVVWTELISGINWQEMVSGDRRTWTGSFALPG